MQEETKKVIIRIMNTISLVGNVCSLLLMCAINILMQYADKIPELSDLFETLNNSNISILQQGIVLGICIVFSIINLVLSKNIQKNENKIVFLMAISMMVGSIYNIIAGFVCIIMIYKRKKRRNEGRR